MIEFARHLMSYVYGRESLQGYSYFTEPFKKLNRLRNFVLSVSELCALLTVQGGRGGGGNVCGRFPSSSP